jgi:hypothetical protein
MSTLDDPSRGDQLLMPKQSLTYDVAGGRFP